MPDQDDARRGAEHFLREEYEDAEARFDAALARDPSNGALRRLRDRARQNVLAEIRTFVPPLAFFDGETLLRRADASPLNLPAPPLTRRVPWYARMRLRVGNILGALATLLMGAATHLWGAVRGYRGRLWTNWYRRPLPSGILTLAFMRERLNARNLRSTYPEGSLIGFQPEGQIPPEGATHFRTADGTWNNLADPKEGAAGTRFHRNVHPDAVRPESGERLMTPNPREISLKLLTRAGDMMEVPFLNLLAAAWIQFENHDWISHGEPDTSEPHALPPLEDDLARPGCFTPPMRVGRTQRDPTRREGAEPTSISFVNEVTHWWDGSQLYGSDQETQARLRSFVGGRLRLDDAGHLPIAADGVEDTGFRRNWWVGLTLLHTLFVREHNTICERLRMSHPLWDDERLFQVARLVNAAVMAKIHTVEWTPAILPNRGLDAALNANWFGLLTNLFVYGTERDTLGDINIRNPELGGVVGNPLDKHGQPYGLTQEFVEVYRLHSLLPESLKLRNLQGERAEEVPLAATRQAGSRKLLQRFRIADVLHSFGVQHPGRLVLNNFPRFMQELSIPGSPLIDLGAVDILRARERGVPRYNEFRRQLGLRPIGSFADLGDDRVQVARLEEVYGPGGVEDLDLLIGTLAEGHRPTGFAFGETLFQIFILNATRRLQADRFYTDCYDEETYTRAGLDWIDSATLKSVLLRHYPELGSTGLANVTNAFEPWDTDAILSPERHPLRAWNKELRPDPWRGDAHRSRNGPKGGGAAQRAP